MPSYDYKCNKCQNEFGMTASISEKEKLKPVCPKCGAEAHQIFKKMNVLSNKPEMDDDMPDLGDEEMGGMPMGMPPGMGGMMPPGCGRGMCGPGFGM